ncbi:hypothetical protein Bbelb_034370 [Branchiostoma belcheri]|nr:hypothetical protein Bbelb_034370 [Branchiostoma belcheri]
MAWWELLSEPDKTDWMTRPGDLKTQDSEYEVWKADAVYLTMWDLSMLLCVLWDLISYPVYLSWRTCLCSCWTCAPDHIPGGSVFLSIPGGCTCVSEEPVSSYEAREHRT